jgi:hypothetical protein
MKNLSAMLVLGAFVVAMLLIGWPRGATADKPTGCQQWEVMLTQATHMTIDVKSLPEAGKPVIETAPPGWEPFAFGPSGQLVYRRCAK